jgi:hypothetical protein
LIVLPAFEETLETYEILEGYWRNKRQTCCIRRLPFFLALQQNFNWKDSRLYIVQGIFQVFGGNKKLVVFNFTDAVDVDINTKVE